jgi:hypothetical protein
LPRYTERPQADLQDADPAVVLPYGMDAAGVVAAINDLYSYLHALNKASVEYGYDRLEDIQLRAAFSGLVSEIMVRSLAVSMSNRVPGLARNLYPNGHPDLIPRAMFLGDSVQNGHAGVEVKAARNPTSIQAHNTGENWYCVIEFSCDVVTVPIYDREPTTIQRVRVAELEHSDWKFSGRSATSRRTPTASITKDGREKLEAGAVYVRGGTAGYAAYTLALKATAKNVRAAKKAAKKAAEKAAEKAAQEADKKAAGKAATEAVDKASEVPVSALSPRERNEAPPTVD